MNSGSLIKVYTAESQTKHLGQVFSEMISGIRNSRYIAYRLVLKDVRADYSKSAFGIVWDFVDPLVIGLIFYLLMEMKIFRTEVPTMPYAVFVIYGLLLFETFCESIMVSLNCMQRSKTILTHLKIPPEALILSVLFRVLFNSFFRITIMLGFSLVLYYSAFGVGKSTFSPIGFIAFLALFPGLIFAGMSIGILLAPFNVIYSDVGRFVRVSLIPLRYATPVLYNFPEHAGSASLQKILDWTNFLNPITPLVVNLRLLATSGQFIMVTETVIRLGVFALIFLVGWFIFHLSIPVMADRA